MIVYPVYVGFPEGLSPSMAGFSLSASGKPNIVFGVAEGKLAVLAINY
ncbi:MULTISPECIES: hypothetical protein [environmental samples]|nr:MULTISPECIES: hypothetical protein [environmental samples]